MREQLKNTERDKKTLEDKVCCWSCDVMGCFGGKGLNCLGLQAASSTCTWVRCASICNSNNVHLRLHSYMCIGQYVCMLDDVCA